MPLLSLHYGKGIGRVVRGHTFQGFNQTQIGNLDFGKHIIYWLLNNCFENLHVELIMKAPI